MPGLDFMLSVLPLSGGLWAYGPAPGVELIPYFLGLAAWVGMAFLAVLLAPFSALLRRLRSNIECSAPGPDERRGSLGHLQLNPKRSSSTLGIRKDHSLIFCYLIMSS